MNAFVIALLLSAAHIGPQTQPAAYLKPLACRSDAELTAVLKKSFDQIQRNELKSVPWRVFVLMREFQRSGYIVTPLVRATVCEGNQWLYGEQFAPPSQDFIPRNPIRLDPTWNTVG